MKQHIRRAACSVCAALWLAAVLAGCGAQSSDAQSTAPARSGAAPGSSAGAAASAASAPPQEETETPGITWQPGDVCAVAALGYGQDTDALAADWAHKSGITPAAQVLAPGDENYVVIPRDTGCTVQVLACTMDAATGSVSTGAVLYSGGGAAFVLRCNESDILQNVLVRVTANGETLEFSPYLSLADGSLVLPGTGGVQDVTVYPESGEVPFAVPSAWNAEAQAADGTMLMLRLEFAAGGLAVFTRTPEDGQNSAEVFRGSWRLQQDGSLALELAGDSDTLTCACTPEQAEADVLSLTYLSGDALYPGFDDGTVLAFLADTGAQG